MLWILLNYHIVIIYIFLSAAFIYMDSSFGVMYLSCLEIDFRLQLMDSAARIECPDYAKLHPKAVSFDKYLHPHSGMFILLVALICVFFVCVCMLYLEDAVLVSVCTKQYCIVVLQLRLPDV